jgi:nuclear pore complex protein Nup155
MPLTSPPRAGRDVFGRGSGDKGAAVVYMAPIPPSDSQRLHLLTVTADGRRVFWSTAPARYGAGAEGESRDGSAMSHP